MYHSERSTRCGTRDRGWCEVLGVKPCGTRLEKTKGGDNAVRLPKILVRVRLVLKITEGGNKDVLCPPLEGGNKDVLCPPLERIVWRCDAGIRPLLALSLDSLSGPMWRCNAGIVHGPETAPAVASRGCGASRTAQRPAVQCSKAGKAERKPGLVF